MTRLRTWLQLLRAPNLFTVPGDPLAGYLFANMDMGRIDGTLIPIIAAGLCFYAAGLLQNDLADEDEDRRDRPQRPLPSGAASRGSVRAVLWVLNLAGLSALWFTGNPMQELKVGGALVVAVWLYNRVTKGWPVIGALNMGACRGLSVMLGAFTGPGPFQPAAPIAILFGLYIAAVTNLARHETRPRTPVLARLLPILPVAFIAAIISKFALFSPAKEPVVLIFGLALASVAWLLVKMFRTPAPPLPPLIGAHIRVLLPLQAAICYFADPWGTGRIAAIVLLACWPLSRAVSRRFYAS